MSRTPCSQWMAQELQRKFCCSQQLGSVSVTVFCCTLLSDSNKDHYVHPVHTINISTKNMDFSFTPPVCLSTLIFAHVSLFTLLITVNAILFYIPPLHKILKTKCASILYFSHIQQQVRRNLSRISFIKN